MNWFNRLGKAVAGATQVPDPAVREALANLTPRAQQVLVLARKEADRFHHNFVGTEHLLLGLIALGQGTAVHVLERMGVVLESVRKEVENQVGTGPDQKVLGNIPYTPRVKKVLALADKERKALSHAYLGTEHILLGLLREGDGVAARVLRNLEVDIEITRREILKELDPNFEVTEAAPIQPEAGPESEPASPRPGLEPLDLSKRYDIYCTERDHDLVVYRNALFKGVRSLFRDENEALPVFLELEQSDGTTIFVAKYSVIKFCEPGVTPGGTRVCGEGT